MVVNHERDEELPSQILNEPTAVSGSSFEQVGLVLMPGKAVTDGSVSRNVAS